MVDVLQHKLWLVGDRIEDVPQVVDGFTAADRCRLHADLDALMFRAHGNVSPKLQSQYAAIDRKGAR